MKSFSEYLPNALRQAVHKPLRSPATRKWGLILLIAIVVYGILGFLVAPPLIRHYATPLLSQSLSRPVSIGSISLNPFTLRFEVGQVHVSKLQGQGDFASFGKLVLRLSWSSLFRLKPIINEVWLDTPSVNVTRTAPRQFNFSDLIKRYSKPGKSSGKPTRFSVSNIHLDDGSINFDDGVLNKQHHIKHLRIGIPFVANLPSATHIFVKPLLQARIDGSPLLIIGNTKPFDASFESNVTLKLTDLNLPQLMSYVPAALPIKLPQGRLSSNLNLQFSIADGTPHVLISGAVRLDDVSITDTTGQPLFNAERIRVVASSIEPLQKIFHLSDIQIDKPALFLSRTNTGTLNLTALTADAGKKPATTVATADAKTASKTAGKAPNKPQPAEPLDFSLHHLVLNGGNIHFQDKKTATPVQLDLAALNLAVIDFNTLGKQPATYSMQARLQQKGESRGSISGTGRLIYAEHELKADIGFKALSLPTFQPYLDTVLAGHIDQGSVDAHGKLSANWAAPAVSLTLSDAGASLSGFSLSAAGDAKPVVKLARADVEIQQVDLAAHSADVSSVNLQGLDATVQRDRHGAINLTALLKQSKTDRRKAATTDDKKPTGESSTSTWRYHLGAFALSQSAIHFTDLTNTKPVALQISALQFKLQNITQDMHKAWPFDLSATLQKKGSIALGGTLTVAPLALKLHVRSRHIDVAAFEPYFGKQINASIASAWLYVNGDTRLARAGSGWRVNYDGSAGLGGVRMLDKSTSDLFAGWRRLHLSHIKAVYDANGPDVSVGQIALSDFFARIFLDSKGNLNLSHFLASKNTAPTSLTRDEASGATEPTQTPETKSETKSSAANLRFGEIVLNSGSVDYADNFIKPNYSAKLVNIQGKVGAFGTQSSQPAPVDLKADLSTGGSVVIGGTVNPLTKPPFLNMTAHASDIELPQFASYSSKYTGYPIEKGKLQVDLNYQLDHGQLTAKNHLFIDQLTFGNHVDSPTASNLPVRLAVSLLKNSRGEIDLNIPISGSLSNPQFSIGGLVWQAITGLIRKAITSPFSLLASAFGGSEQLSYIAFDPGSATLSAKAIGKLNTLTKALADRPAIELDISGLVDPAKDISGLRRMQVEQQVKAQKVKALRDDGKHIKSADVKVAADEYDKYLRLAYKAADFKKPRNFIGFTKSLPPAQMKQLMLDNAKAGSEDLRALAQQRAAVVQQWFKGKIDDKRIYVVAPKVEASKSDSKGPRVEFSLKR